MGLFTAIVVLTLLGQPAGAASKARLCQQACGGLIAACAARNRDLGDFERACKKAVLKRCRKGGSELCVPTTTTTTTTSTTTSTIPICGMCASGLGCQGKNEFDDCGNTVGCDGSPISICTSFGPLTNFKTDCRPTTEGALRCHSEGAPNSFTTCTSSSDCPAAEACFTDIGTEPRCANVCCN